MTSKFPTLRTRCQLKVLHREASVAICCTKLATSVIRHARGDQFRACSQHRRMAEQGLVDPKGEVLSEYARERLRRTGGEPPYKGKWKVCAK